MSGLEGEGQGDALPAFIGLNFSNSIKRQVCANLVFFG